MKRIATLLGLIAMTATARATAQAHVSVSVGIAVPHVSGYVVVGDPYAYRPGVVVIDTRPRYHRSRVVVIKRPRVVVIKRHGHHKHRYHRHHRW